MIPNQNPDYCDHHALSFIYDYDDPTPVKCEGCQKLFPMWEAVTHVRTLCPNPQKGRFGKLVSTLEEAQASGVAHITMAYSVASKEYKHTRRMWYAFPDFNIKVGGASRKTVQLNAREQLEELLSLNMLAFRQPPIPIYRELLKKQYPELANWDWHDACIDVAHLFLPPGSSDKQLALPFDT
jgi:hypothetical protein